MGSSRSGWCRRKADSSFQSLLSELMFALKRVYECALKNSDGNCETRYVLAECWLGWLSYHASLPQSLQGFVPPMLGYAMEFLCRMDS